MTMNAALKPSVPATMPPTSGPRTNPRSPAKRNRPTAIPESCGGATSESMAAGVDAAAPDASPTRPIRAASATGLLAQPSVAPRMASAAMDRRTTRFRPALSATLAVG